MPEDETPVVGAPQTIEERLEASGESTTTDAVLEAVVPALNQAIDTKFAEMKPEELPFKIENGLNGIEPILCFGLGRNGKPGHWFEYRPME